MTSMTQAELEEVLRKHALWLEGLDGGERANLTRAILTRANLRRADMEGANLTRANLTHASLTNANLKGANLADASLRDADLTNANLTRANLLGVVGNMCEIKSLQLQGWPATYTAEILQIGCQRHLIKDWWGFSDEKISNMDALALEWWRKWKEILRQIIELNPATPTGHEGKAH